MQSLVHISQNGKWSVLPYLLAIQMSILYVVQPIFVTIVAVDIIARSSNRPSNRLTVGTVKIKNSVKIFSTGCSK